MRPSDRPGHRIAKGQAIPPVWQAAAQFLHQHRDEMHAELAPESNNIVTIWFDNSDPFHAIYTLSDLLLRIFSAHGCGPIQGDKWSFWFETEDALAEARRILNLPAGLHAADWGRERVERK